MVTTQLLRHNAFLAKRARFSFTSLNITATKFCGMHIKRAHGLGKQTIKKNWIKNASSKKSRNAWDLNTEQINIPYQRWPHQKGSTWYEVNRNLSESTKFRYVICSAPNLAYRIEDISLFIQDPNNFIVFTTSTWSACYEWNDSGHILHHI